MVLINIIYLCVAKFQLSYTQRIAATSEVVFEEKLTRVDGLVEGVFVDVEEEDVLVVLQLGRRHDVRLLRDGRR